MKIPKIIKLAGRDIYVVFNNKICDDRGILGSCDFWQDIILLCTHHRNVDNKKDNIKINRDVINLTFIHELLHFMFHMLHRKDLENDEKIVSQLSELIYQIIKQIK